jgi:hypothetical protein
LVTGGRKNPFLRLAFKFGGFSARYRLAYVSPANFSLGKAAKFSGPAENSYFLFFLN